jgi:hypothetical protein
MIVHFYSPLLSLWRYPESPKSDAFGKFHNKKAMDVLHSFSRYLYYESDLWNRQKNIIERKQAIKMA